MKINFNNSITTVELWNVAVGATFMAKRTHSNDNGLYMKIDHKNKYLHNTVNRNYAINLQTGQIREFILDAKVVPIVAEVNVV